ncbi:MAG: thioredoxin-dependent thiol peroxidase [Candidatus Thermoplasmatota archaeon]|nr:thioredoxin-dependent thiol peroxidase [Candidatus Thermoplasmatota archaeon]
MESLHIGDKAPDFCLKDQDEEEICLKDFKGKNVVLYFYPKDNTPGCSLEAMTFTRFKDDFEKHNTTIIGVSKDSCESHKKFIKNKNLNITLISDSDIKIQKVYGVWRLKKFMGKEFMGTVRSTFLINSTGKISRIWDNVKVKGHVEEVLEAVKEL